MKARTSGAVQGIMFLIVLPLTLRQQHLRPTDTMPGWLQAFVKVNPIRQLVTTVRGLMIGGPVAGQPDVDAGLDGGAAGRVRAAGAARLPPARLSTAREVDRPAPSAEGAGRCGVVAGGVDLGEGGERVDGAALRVPAVEVGARVGAQTPR